MKVQQVKIANFKGIESLQSDLKGRSVYVVGGNAAGKSSFIDAVFCALTGKNVPPSPITGNKRSGEITVELDTMLIELKFKKDAKGKIKKELALYNTEDGDKLDSPRARIDAVIGTIEFDPFAFMRMQPKPQLDYFCKVFGIKGIVAIDDEYQELNDIIAFDRKELNALKLRLEPYDKELAEKETVSASRLADELNKANQHNSMISNFESKLESEIKRHDELVDELTRVKDLLAQSKEKLTKGEAWLKDQHKIDTTDMIKTLNNLEAENTKIREAKELKGLHAKADTLEESIAQATEGKSEKLAEKKAKISEFTKNVEGLDYTEDGFMLDGLPFHADQNNTAAQIVAGLKLGAGLLGDVKIARFEGSLLDRENLEAVNKFAEQTGLQLFVELVDRDEKGLRLEFIEH